MASWRASTPASFARRSRPTCPPPSPRRSAARLTPLAPDPALVARLGAALDRLVPSSPLGLAVSGGADSTALLLLAAAARPGRVTALSIDHGLRVQSADEVEAVGALCDALGVPHRCARLSLADGPDLQGRARAARYAALGEMADDLGLAAVATAHHADDQAETLVMRLSRGAGVSGLAGVREVQDIGGLRVLRPLLDWRKGELEDICRAADVAWSEDPSNRNPRFTRAAVREAMRGLDLDPKALSASAAALAMADEALDWATGEASDRLLVRDGEARLDPAGLPDEILRRLLLRAFASLGAPVPRGGDLMRAIEALRADRRASLSGLLLAPAADGRWRLAPEPPRTPRA